MAGFLTWLYRKLGSKYPAAFLTVELQSAFLVTAGTLALIGVYYELSEDLWTIVAIAFALTAVAVWLNLIRTFPLLRPIARWIKGDRSDEASSEAWAAAVGLPFELLRRDLWVPLAVVVVPTCAAAVALIGLSWLAFFPLFIASLVAVGYGGILHSLALERGMRPVLVDINSQLPPRKQIAHRAIPLRVRLVASLPLINIVTGFVVLALTNESPGTPSLEADFLFAIGISTAMSLEITLLLSKSILSPLSDLQRSTEQVRRGDYETSVPVTTGDELGELAASFNEMVGGLAERERIREAFGTYLDRDVAEHILSEGFDRAGVEADVSVLMLDVVDFTDFAARSEAREVVSCLNELFEIAVPAIYRHGGHVDKFIGDGLLAVFGAPEPFEDHADRAVRAAVEIARAINEEDDGPFTIGIGVNSGRVVAGSIGGAGRLNYSVIGDPVNVVARIEACTRDTGDDVLLSEETRRRLSQPVELESRGKRELKGVPEPLEVHAPAERVRGLAREAEGDGRQARGRPSTEEPFPLPGGRIGPRAESPG